MHSTPNLLRSFYKGYKLQRRIKNEQDWFLGKYIYDAFSVVMDHVCAGMAGKKSNSEYPKEPYELDGAKNAENMESKEEIAVFEMKQRINILKNQGLPESPR